LVRGNPLPELLEAGEQKAGVARFLKIGFVPAAAEIGDPGQMHAKPPAVIVAAAQALARLRQQVLREIVCALLGAQIGSSTCW